MANTSSQNKQATCEDYAESDDEKATRPASNSSLKRSHPTLNTGRSSSSKPRPASDLGQTEAPPPVKDAPSRQPEKPTTQAGAKDEVSSEPGARRPYKPRRSSQANPPPSPRKVPKEDRPRSTERQPRERCPPSGPCHCEDCLSASRHIPRPGIDPLQQDRRANTLPARHPHGPLPGFIPPGHIPPGRMPPPGARLQYPPTGSFPGGHPPPSYMVPTFDPRLQPMHSGMPPPHHASMYAPSAVSMPPTLPSVGGPPPPRRIPIRPAIHHPEQTKPSSSRPQFSSKISTYDTSSAPFSTDDDEHFSTRNLPARPHHVPGDFESGSYSSESPPDSPPYIETPRRPHPFQRATTSEVQQIHRSGHSRSRSDYPAESAYRYRRELPSGPTWDQYAHAEYREYEDQRSYPSGRRGSNATTWTQQTSASDPPYPGYVHYERHGRHDSYPDQEYAATDYMDRARGHPEERITVETLRQLPSGGPRSTRSNHSHRRSQHSTSETSSRYRGAEGSMKLIMPITAAEETKIQLSGDMGDREVSFRSINDPGMVEVTIGTVNGGERRYLKSASQTSRAPTRSSGSTRHATRGGTEGKEQRREHREHREHIHTSRAPSSRKS